MAFKVFLLLVAGLILSQSCLSSGYLTPKSLATIRYYYYNVGQGIIMAPSVITGSADATGLLSVDRETVVIIHGHEESAFLPVLSSGPSIRSAFIDRDRLDTSVDFDIIVVDWSIFSTLPYTSAITAVPLIAQGLVTFLNELLNAGLVSQARLHLVGYDLGAHVAGLTGRNLDQLPARITGLDPTGDGFKGNALCLSATDATYVEVIHTDAIGNRAIGIGEPIGSADYFPNGGTRQPGCSSNNACNHRRAFELFDATVVYPGALLANQCTIWSQVTSNRCTGIQQAMGGTDVFKTRFGLFRVNTGTTYPYTL